MANWSAVKASHVLPGLVTRLLVGTRTQPDADAGYLHCARYLSEL
jgi:hypothetical protein